MRAHAADAPRSRPRWQHLGARALAGVVSVVLATSSPALADSFDDQRRDAQERAAEQERRSAELEESIEGMSADLAQAVLDLESTKALLPAAEEAFRPGYPDGAGWGTPFWRRSAEPYGRFLEVGPYAGLLLARAVAPAMVAARTGLLALVSFGTEDGYLGDLFYDAVLAARVTAFLDRCLGAGMAVLIGDPYRAHLPTTRLDAIANYPGPDFAGFASDAGRLNSVFQFLTETHAEDR